MVFPESLSIAQGVHIFGGLGNHRRCPWTSQPCLITRLYQHVLHVLANIRSISLHEYIYIYIYIYLFIYIFKYIYIYTCVDQSIRPPRGRDVRDVRDVRGPCPSAPSSLRWGTSSANDGHGLDRSGKDGSSTSKQQKTLIVYSFTCIYLYIYIYIMLFIFIYI